MATGFDPYNVGQPDYTRYNPQNTGYGTGEAVPRAPAVTNAVRTPITSLIGEAGVSATPPGVVTGGTVAPSARVPFYNRPIPVPSWLKSAGGFLGRGLGVAGAVGTGLGIAGGVYTAADVLKNAAEPALVDAMSGPSILGPAGQDFASRSPAASTGYGIHPAASVSGAAPVSTEVDQATMGQNNLAAANAPGFAGGFVQPNGTVNTAPAAAFTSVDRETSAALSAARQAAANRGDFAAVRDSYQANGGTFQGRTAVEDTRQNALTDSLGMIHKARTVAQQNSAIALTNSLLTNETARASHEATLGVTRAENQRKALHDANTFALDSITKPAEAEKNRAAAAHSNFGFALTQEALNPNLTEAQRSTLQSASGILSGRPSASSVFHEATTAAPKSGFVVMTDSRNGNAVSQPIRQVNPVAKGTDGKFYLLGPDGKAQREATAEEQKRYAVIK